jgi:hypothetical protein
LDLNVLPICSNLPPLSADAATVLAIFQNIATAVHPLVLRINSKIRLSFAERLVETVTFLKIVLATVPHVLPMVRRALVRFVERLMGNATKKRFAMERPLIALPMDSITERNAEHLRERATLQKNVPANLDIVHQMAFNLPAPFVDPQRIVVIRQSIVPDALLLVQMTCSNPAELYVELLEVTAMLLNDVTELLRPVLLT